MIFDSHSHTQFSSDSDMQASEALTRAEKLGLGLVFTEHYDYEYLTCNNFKDAPDMDFRFVAEDYWQAYEALRGERLCLGVEIGMTDGSIEPNKEFISQAPFDQVIGSIHFMENFDLYYRDYYNNKSKAEAYSKYLVEMSRQIAQNSYIDVLGHIDYICRYATFVDKELKYSQFSDEIDGVLRTALENDVIMELNTRRLGNELTLSELEPIYRQYYKLGGRYVTLGSDAHSSDAIGMNFTVAVDFATEIGLQIVTFKNRQMEKCRR